MITVSSTEFQQRVGYYLGLAEEGETVQVKRKKPKKQDFYVTRAKLVAKKPVNKFEEMLKYIEKHSFVSKKYKSGLELQRKVRS